MSDERRFHEMNEQELEQVAGGDREIASKKFCCPNCGRTELLCYFKDSECEAPICTKCDINRLGRYRMIPV